VHTSPLRVGCSRYIARPFPLFSPPPFARRHVFRIPALRGAVYIAGRSVAPCTKPTTTTCAICVAQPLDTQLVPGRERTPPGPAHLPPRGKGLGGGHILFWQVMSLKFAHPHGRNPLPPRLDLLLVLCPLRTCFSQRVSRSDCCLPLLHGFLPLYSAKPFEITRVSLRVPPKLVGILRTPPGSFARHPFFSTWHPGPQSPALSSDLALFWWFPTPILRSSSPPAGVLLAVFQNSLRSPPPFKDHLGPPRRFGGPKVVFLQRRPKFFFPRTRGRPPGAPLRTDWPGKDSLLLFEAPLFRDHPDTSQTMLILTSQGTVRVIASPFTCNARRVPPPLGGRVRCGLAVFF